MIRVHDLCMRFGHALAVDRATLDIPAGDSLALWGANGAGKTTLIRCVLGLLRFRGRVHVAGHDVAREGKLARLAVGYVPQELGFHDDLGVGEAVGFFARLKGLSGVNSAQPLEHVGLTGHEHKRVRELSGGMKQRLALAIALLGDPPILVLDEVTASLDAVGRDEFVHLLASLASSGRTMLFASHRIEEVAALAKRVVVMEQGRVTLAAPCADFVARYAHAAHLHLTIHASLRDHAVRTLKSAGFAPQLNAVGVIVPVTPDHKAAPFRALANDGIPVDDFELVHLDTSHSSSEAAR